MSRFTSRKFLVTFGALLIAVGGAVSGQLPWPDATWSAVAAVLGYLGVEGVRDIRISTPAER